MFTCSKDLTWNVLKISKIYFLIADHISDFFSKISAILLSTDSHIKCIVCICVSFLYIQSDFWNFALSLDP